jgi:hypothetical protein
MGWLDNLWRRRQREKTETDREAAEARVGEETPQAGADEADLLEEDAHRFRDEEIFREPRIPPGTG